MTFEEEIHQRSSGKSGKRNGKGPKGVNLLADAPEKQNEFDVNG